MPTVSVIVPNYNHARFLRRRIDSILAQTFQDFELILLDDSSADESRTILQEFTTDPRVRFDFNEVNSGSPFKQWNKGVGLALGKYVWIAESDDYADAQLLKQLVGVLDSDPTVTFAYCRSHCVWEGDLVDGLADFYLEKLNAHQWARDFRVGGTEICRNYFTRTNPIPNASAVVFRKDVYKAVGGADESLRICGDWKLWAGMALMGSVGYICKPLNYFRYHPASVRNRTELARADVPEHLAVTRWVLDRVTVSGDLLENICEDKAQLWVPALMSLRVPLSLKRMIAAEVRAIDPHPVRRLARPALATVQRKILRHWRELRSLVTPART